MIEGHYTRKLTNGECPYKLVYFEADLLRNIIDDHDMLSVTILLNII
ncbi:hypothetical protein [Methanobrevibacter smithii]